MPVIYATSVKDARLTATRDAAAGGTLELQAANDAVLAIFDLTAGGGTVSNAVWTLAFDESTVQGEAAAGSGTAATKARIKNSGGTAIITGLTVGTSSADVVLNNASIAEEQEITLTGATITHAPDPE